MLLIDRDCFERGCACYDSRDKGECVEVVEKRTWEGLTDEEIEEGIKQSWVTEQAFQSAAWWAEAKLKEKNT